MLLENVPSSSTEPLLFTKDENDEKYFYQKNNKNYKFTKSKISFLSVMWRQKRIILIKILKILIFAVILGWIYFTYQNFIKTYYFIKDYDYSSSSSLSSIYESIYGPIQNYYMEWDEEDIDENDKIDKFRIELKNANISYYFFRDELLECNDTKLLIVIPSRTNAYQTRMAIRNSWLKNLTSTVTYRFIIGSTTNLTIKESNHQEFEEFNDLIISSIRDSYLNLTLKTFSILQWQQKYCPKIEYLLKTDDDTVVDVSRLQYWIENDYQKISKNFNNKVIFGRIWSKAKPRRDPKQKWFTPYQAWNRKYFPNYCNGPTYLLTANAVEGILNQSINHYLISIEDVFFTGILAEAAGIKRIDRWKNFGRGNAIDASQGCDEKNVPYLTSIYEIKNDKFLYLEGKNNLFSEATEKLFALKC